MQNGDRGCIAALDERALPRRAALTVLLAGLSAAAVCTGTPGEGSLPGELRWVRHFPDAGVERFRLAEDGVTLAALVRGSAVFCDRPLGSEAGEAWSLVVLRFSEDLQCPLVWSRELEGDWRSMGSADSPPLERGRLNVTTSAGGTVHVTAGRVAGDFALGGGLHLEAPGSHPRAVGVDRGDVLGARARGRRGDTRRARREPRRRGTRGHRAALRAGGTSTSGSRACRQPTAASRGARRSRPRAPPRSARASSCRVASSCAAER